MMKSITLKPRFQDLLWDLASSVRRPQWVNPFHKSSKRLHVDTLPLALLRDLGLEQDQLRSNIDLAGAQYQKLFW